MSTSIIEQLGYQLASFRPGGTDPVTSPAWGKTVDGVHYFLQPGYRQAWFEARNQARVAQFRWQASDAEPALTVEIVRDIETALAKAL